MSKFASFAEYPPRSLAGAEAALLTAWASLERFQDDLVLVGGVPDLAQRADHDLVQPHVDLVLGPEETGGRVALPVFREIILRIYRKNLAGPVPEFPAQMEQNINDFLSGTSVARSVVIGTSPDTKHELP